MEEYFRIRQEKLEKIKELGVDIYPYSFDKTHNFDEIIDKYKDLPEAEFESLTEEFRVAGRIITVRKMGKSSFVHLYDGTAKLQVYVRKDKVEELDYDVFKLLDIGDIVGIAGNLFRTRTGELTILVSKLTLLTKSFHPLP
jgi:lysyl-tRNA synthetase class 2